MAVSAGPRHELVILFDVDNTLLDNDGVRSRLEAEIQGAVGPDRAERFWQLYEQVREELDFVNFPETMERFGRECDDSGCLGPLAGVLYGFPFAECLYAGAEAAIAHAKRLGLPVILSDGDQLFQRHKIRDAGLEAAVVPQMHPHQTLPYLPEIRYKKMQKLMDDHVVSYIFFKIE